MKTTPDSHNNKNGAEPLQASEQQAGYPDISKASTKTVIIVSLLCIVMILLLSIFLPDTSKNTGSTEQTSEIPSATELTTESSKTPDTEEASSKLFDMGHTKTSAVTEVFSLQVLEEPKPGFADINGSTYYFSNNSTRYTGWLMVDDTCYCFRPDGTMVTGWYLTEGKQYYFSEDGVMQTSQWVDDKYVGENGYVLTNTVTPDGNYVGADGRRNNSVSLETSKEGLTDLENELETITKGYSGSWSVYVKDIQNNEYLTVNNVQHFSASLIKLFCAAAVYDLIERGTLEETERVDSLLQQMISISDNDAFNLLVMECDEKRSHIAGRGIIQDYINQNGYKDTTITSMLVPTKYKAPSSPGRNYTTVVDCGLLLEKIYKGKCVSPEASEAFLTLLLNQTHLNKIPAGLPEGTKCANKTGDTDEVQHDASIVYSPGGDYILCVMSSGCGAAITNTQNISKTVYEYFN